MVYIHESIDLAANVLCIFKKLDFDLRVETVLIGNEHVCGN